MTLGAPAKKHGEPGKASCSSTTPLSASAFCTTRLPASVAGPVPAARGMGMKPLASPCSAATRFASRFGPSWPSGSTAHCMKLRIGLSRSLSTPPAMAAEHGLASGFMPMPLAAGTGPATLAGNLVVQNAEALSGVVLLQLAYPGSPCFFAGDLLHDGVDLGLHHHVRIAEDLGAVQQAGAVHHVGAAHDAGEGTQGVVDGGLPVWLLGAGGHGPHRHGHAVEVGQLGAGGGEQVVLGRAAAST